MKMPLWGGMYVILEWHGVECTEMNNECVVWGKLKFHINLPKNIYVSKSVNDWVF